MIEIIQTQKDSIDILTIIGRLDTNTSTQLEGDLIQLLENDRVRIVLDFSQLEFISSSGLRVLLMIAKRLKGVNGKMLLCAMQEHVKEVFDIAGFTMLFSIYESLEDAVKEL